MKWFYSTTVFFLKGFFRIFYRLSIYGANHPYPGKAILAPNHASFLDPPLIGAAWPEDAHFLARATLFRHWAGKMILSNLNTHPVNGTAQDIESFRMICRLLDEGKKVVIFPEGERSPTGELQTIKSGIAMLAMRMQCPIIPVYIQGTFEAWPKHQRWPKFGAPITCVFGKPIFLDLSDSMDKKQKQELISQQVQQKLEELRLWLEAGAQGEPP
jgi:1-acyl-sn-glycerol-3-phosphate acyltransferase